VAFYANKVKQKKTVYNRLKAVLAEKGRTNLWLANHLKMNKTTISKWCTNKAQPSIETFHEIAEALKVDVRELIVPNKGSK
jgi:putative transcriptional regulator